MRPVILNSSTLGNSLLYFSFQFSSDTLTVTGISLVLSHPPGRHLPQVRLPANLPAFSGISMKKGIPGTLFANSGALSTHCSTHHSLPAYFAYLGSMKKVSISFFTLCFLECSKTKRECEHEIEVASAEGSSTDFSLKNNLNFEPTIYSPGCK